MFDLLIQIEFFFLNNAKKLIQEKIYMISYEQLRVRGGVRVYSKQ